MVPSRCITSSLLFPSFSDRDRRFRHPEIQGTYFASCAFGFRVSEVPLLGAPFLPFLLLHQLSRAWPSGLITTLFLLHKTDFDSEPLEPPNFLSSRMLISGGPLVPAIPLTLGFDYKGTVPFPGSPTDRRLVDGRVRR